MSHRKPLVAFVVASVAFSSLAFVGRGLAAAPITCTSDPECPRGFTCQPWAVSGGSAPACPADAPDCAVTNTPKSGNGGAGGGTGTSGSPGAGATTGSDDGAGNVSGTTPPTTVISRCEPGPCQTDSDCGPDMVCHTESYSECSGGKAVLPCEPNTNCASTDVVTEPTCTTKTTSTCAFHWQLPCNANADCGAGFTCQPQSSGSCSGGTPVSGGSGPTGVGGTGGAESAPSGAASSPSPTCTSTESFPGWCRLVDTICNVDADCPGSWVCQDAVTPASRGSASGAGATSGSGDVGSGTSATGAEIAATGGVPGGTTASSRMCVSPFSSPTMSSDSGAGGRLGDGEGTTTPTNGGTPPDGTSGTGGTTAVSGKGGPAGGGGTNGAATPEDAASASNGAGGCSVAGSGAGSRVSAGLSMLALLGLGVVARRRRR